MHCIKSYAACVRQAETWYGGVTGILMDSSNHRQIVCFKTTEGLHPPPPHSFLAALRRYYSVASFELSPFFWGPLFALQCCRILLWLWSMQCGGYCCCCLLITENKNGCSGHSHSILWEKPHEYPHYSYWISESIEAHIISRMFIICLANIAIMQRLRWQVKFSKSGFFHWNVESREAGILRELFGL